MLVKKFTLLLDQLHQKGPQNNRFEGLNQSKKFS